MLFVEYLLNLVVLNMVWVHDTIIDMDILTASGEVLYCTRDNENKDLFNAIPNLMVL